ncbi:hypothetical protein C7S20_05675 [Christiangramia fulva]|uniref:Endonuclease n=1 Tax=Christiangramia fulva TaxID=2126553 RepID=A0A2R3Z3F2_9FLAO|nr:NUMOD4 domain-containing protein [Christiangramia fulva]AVR44797.1 hypothetical protein C7S20_05675 [Christiangramia fulva]
MEEEKWEPVKGYEALYEISNIGRVKRLERTFTCSRGIIYHLKEKILSSKPNKTSGYVTVNLSKDGIKTNHSVHRLVAELFVDNPHNNNVVNHKDENRSNNTAENLEWVTHGENIAYNGAFQKGREKVKKKVYQFSLDGALINTYSYAGAVAKDGFTPNAVTQVCLGNKKSHKGYFWKYELINP